MAQDKPDVTDEELEEEESDLPPEVRKSGIVPDIVRRAVLTGVGALFMTEEGLRNMLGDIKMPKEALAYLLSQADKTRTEIARVVTAEVRRFLESETLRREIWKVLTGVTLEVNATIQLKPSGEPGFKAKVRSKGPSGRRGERSPQASESLDSPDPEDDDVP